ncbi:MFS transporter [Jeotgalibacillus marinus]|uniref:MFS transporter n=1 Tax=Jeotgalibacillus marinus TaxID=86667 RepID=A0ABV3Q1R1_9BACL
MKRILYIVFMFNFLFMSLTSILPLLVFSLSNSSASSGYVMATFMLALITVRVYLFYKYIPLKFLSRVGIISYCLGFLVLVMFSETMLSFYIGAVFLGMGVGIVVPILLTLLTKSATNRNGMINYHNILLALASSTGPFIGMYLFDNLARQQLYQILLYMGLSMVLVSLFLGKDPKQENTSMRGLNLKAIFLNKNYSVNFFVFFITSINYGCIIAYLPILLGIREMRIDFFYSIFWLCFALAQIYTSKLAKRVNEKKLMYLFLLVLTICTATLAIVGEYKFLIPIGGLFGFCYGALTNLFYNNIALIDEEKYKTDAFSIFGLMSYLGVGVASFSLSPIAEYSLSLTFLLAALFTLIIVCMFIIFNTISNNKRQRQRA